MRIVYVKGMDRRPVSMDVKRVDADIARRMSRDEAEDAASSALDRARDRLRVAGVHSWTAATVLAIGRPVAAIRWDIVPRMQGEDVDEDKLRDIRMFFSDAGKDFTHIRDYMSMGTKLMYTASSLKLHGQAAWEIIRSDDGEPAGFDVVPGFVVPNVDKDGFLRQPAFVAHLWSGGTVEYDVDDIVYFYSAWLEAAPWGDSEYDALKDVAIPADIYASVAYREIFENINAPYNGVWEVDPETSDEDFEFFLDLLQQRYTGAANFGRNMVVIRGAVNWKETVSLSDEDAPYLRGREFSRDEISSVTGVSTNKLGITAGATKANIRESRRDFFEAAQGPILRIMEETINEQVLARLFGAFEFQFRFRRPDFLNELERATVHMRDIQSGVLSPNEARAEKGYPPRDGGDVYVDPTEARRPDRIAGDGESDVPRPERPPRDEEDTSKE